MKKLSDKSQLLKYLRKDTYCRLKHSRISGVGVFAIKNIPKGVNPFVGPPAQKHIPLTKKDLKTLDKEVRTMIEDFFVFEGDEIWVAKNGLNSISIAWFLNNSKRPNVTFNEKDLSFYTNRPIKKGEEVTLDYDKY